MIPFRCRYLPWHRWRVVRRLSCAADLLQCSCGRLYAVNHDVRAVLKWSDVRSFYEPPPDDETPTVPR